MSKIVIIRGNSGSGKTTVSKLLQRKIGRGTLVIPQDFIRREMLWVNDRPNNQAIGLLENLIMYGRQNCNYVILEGILNSDIYKSLFQKIKELFNDNVYAYYFDLPFEETLQRHNLKSNSHEFGEKEMRGWWREKDFLNNINENSIYKEMSSDDIVELIYKDIMNTE
ncbi:MAG: kinase [Oscillospiraceae bacterium]|nr:kinase [Oscillospiraceae bacterium]